MVPQSLLLDGQQRLTSLYGIVKGQPPKFFEGDQKAISGLYFHLGYEVFEYHAPLKMKDDPLWINITEIFGPQGKEDTIRKLDEVVEKSELADFISRLWRLREITSRELHIEKITGQDKSIEVVVDIFNRVNSGGTKLSKGDLAIARIAAASPATRQRMRENLQRWDREGYDFRMDWLLRNATAIATGKAPFSSLSDVSIEHFDESLSKAVSSIDRLLTLIADRLGLDHNRVLIGRYAFPVLVKFLEKTGGQFPDNATRELAMFWYINSAIWGRYSGSTESVLSQDYEHLNRNGLEGIIEALAQTRGGNLSIQPDDITGFGRGSRFYPLLYMLTRVSGARDLHEGIQLKQVLLGKKSSLELHHIFPKARLKKAGYRLGERNAVANFAFVTQETNLKISDRDPQEYLAEVKAKNPGVLESQWIPTNSSLWTVDAFPEFLIERRKLIADAANSFLDQLRLGLATETEPLPRASWAAETLDDDNVILGEVLSAVSSFGGVSPNLDEEIQHPETGQPMGTFQAVWHNGLQPGQGGPIVFDSEIDRDQQNSLQEVGYTVYASLEPLKRTLTLQAAISSGDRTPDLEDLS